MFMEVQEVLQLRCEVIVIGLQLRGEIFLFREIGGVEFLIDGGEQKYVKCCFKLRGQMVKIQAGKCRVCFKNDKLVLRCIVLIQIFFSDFKEEMLLLFVYIFLGWLMQGEEFFFEMDGG